MTTACTLGHALDRMQDGAVAVEGETVGSRDFELVLLYWQIGYDILTRQAQQGWGAKVIERLAQDLCSAFPRLFAAEPQVHACICRGVA